MTRRRSFLASLAGLSIVTAGCLGTGDDTGEDPGDTDEETTSNDDDPVVPNTEVYEFPPADEPGEAPAEMACPACNHTPADHPEVNAQVVHDDGHRQFLCTPGCFVAYRQAPVQYADSNTPIVRGWVRDVDSGDHHEVDGETFVWVIDTSPDPERGIDPMSNPLPYTDRERAQAYVDQWNELSDEDIVPTPELDREIARKYRDVS